MCVCVYVCVFLRVYVCRYVCVYILISEHEWQSWKVLWQNAFITLFYIHKCIVCIVSCKVLYNSVSLILPC